MNPASKASIPISTEDARNLEVSGEKLLKTKNRSIWLERKNIKR
jgi:hypothetical protein